MIEPFGGKESFCFKKESRLVAPPREFIICRSWMSPNSQEIYWIAFEITAVSRSRPLVSIGDKLDLIKLISYSALSYQRQMARYKSVPNIADESDYLFFCTFRNWVEAQPYLNTHIFNFSDFSISVLALARMTTRSLFRDWSLKVSIWSLYYCQSLFLQIFVMCYCILLGS